MFIRNKNQSRTSSIAGYNRAGHRLGRSTTVRNRRRSFVEGSTKVLAVLGVVAFIAGVIIFNIVNYTTVNEHTACVVAGKDRTVNQEGQSQMRVYTENCGTFQVGDDFLRGNFTSADVFGSLNEGDTYNLTTTGFRIGIMSLFPNIIKVERAN